MIYEYVLNPKYDSCKSFNNKAIVECLNSTQTLYSYRTKVAKIENGKITLYSAWDCSQTTLRHVKEFLRQNNVCIDNITDIHNLIKSGVISEC